MWAIPLICMLPAALPAADVSIAPAIAVVSAVESDFGEQAPSATRLMSNTDIFTAEWNVVIMCLVG